MPSVEDFVAAAGDSLVSAQSGLVDEQPRMALADARLEAKVALDSAEDGIKLQTVSLGDITSGAVESSALSTIRLNFIAFSQDPEVTVPNKTKDDVISEVATRDDLVALDRIFDGLTYGAEFIDSQQQWLVLASSGDDVIRKTIVEDR